MSEHDPRRVLDLVGQALSRPKGECEAFLDEACGADADLRREVEALIAERDRLSEFLRTPAWPSADRSRAASSEAVTDQEDVVTDAASSPPPALSGSRRSIRRIPRAVRALGDWLSPHRSDVSALDISQARPLARYLRETILQCAAHPHAPGGVDPAAARRYRQACACLTPADRELVVGALELGYNYDQLALATDRASPEEVRSAAARALLRLAGEMARV